MPQPSTFVTTGGPAAPPPDPDPGGGDPTPSASAFDFSGEGAPDPATGENGDSYLDIVNGDTYLKEADAWTLSGSIRGQDAILVGEGLPGVGLGANGQAYVNLLNGDVYSRADDLWTLTGSFKGPQGPADGREIVSGNGVPNDANGEDGDTYLNRDTSDLYAKVGGTWLETGDTVRGPKGDTGNGWRGGNGLPSNAEGQNDDHYVDRVTGKVYRKIADVWEDTGASLQGPQGPSGGRSVYTGNGAPNDALGLD
ncbi:MAG: hypothetical protein ACX939_10210, partial [Hyphococcus sp.]